MELLTPELFAAVIAARGNTAIPGGRHPIEYDNFIWWRGLDTNWEKRDKYSSYSEQLNEIDAHNACALHWLGMEAAIGQDITVYFINGVVDIAKLAAAVIEHAKEGT